MRVGGQIVEQRDKGASTERTILATIDATHLLRRFAADQALSVAHLWNMPEIVREYLTTLDESKRKAAGAAALDAAWYAAGAAWYAADAAWDAAWYAAGAAARADFNSRVERAFKEMTNDRPQVHPADHFPG